MRSELPVLKRCCFCLPLRYGLITWGYLKLISTCIGLTALSFVLYFEIKRYYLSGSDLAFYYVEDIAIISTVTVIFIIDAVLTTVFIIGGHQKNPKLMRVYYIYGIVVWALLFIVLSVLMVPIFFYENFSSRRIKVYLIDVSGTLVQILIQTYFLLLLRSEIIKLNTNCEFRFVNNAAQAECTMKYKENVDERGTEESAKKQNSV